MKGKDPVPIITPPENHIFHGFSYDTDTGVIERQKQITPRGKRRLGPVGGKNSDGYLQFCHKNKDYKNHRAAFIFMTIDIPKGMQVDHINGIRADNSWCNLRIVSPRSNSTNRPTHRRGALPGTCFIKRWGMNGKYQARITVNGKVIYLGGYDTEIEAHNAYKNELEKRGL